MMDARNDMLERLRSRREGFTLPQPFYIDPDYFKLDMEMIWYKDWLFVGHDCELDKPGAFMTVQIGDYPIFVVRDLKGKIRAFHNTCRHRGSRICTVEKGSAVRLVCPYHQWSYDLDGRLLFARQVAEGFDKSAYGLKGIACESVAGYLFVCLAETPPDFAPFRRMIEPYFAPHRLAEAKVAHESTIIEKGNWKLVMENNRECYHCSANHPELCKIFPEAPTATGIQSAETDPEMMEHWARLEAAGLPARFRIDPAGQFRVTRTPLLRDTVSYTLSGMPAVGRKSLGLGFLGADGLVDALPLSDDLEPCADRPRDHLPHPADQRQRNRPHDQMAGAQGRGRGRGLRPQGAHPRLDRDQPSGPQNRRGKRARPSLAGL